MALNVLFKIHVVKIFFPNDSGVSSGVVCISPGVTVKGLTECYRYIQITFIGAQITLITPLATKDFHFYRKYPVSLFALLL